MKFATDDAGSLSKLHDIVVAPLAPWWPPAPAWYVVAALLVIGVVLATVWATMRWRRNWYRRAGLAELQKLEQARSQQPTALGELAELLKRVALIAYPRSEIASLTGNDWLCFLDRTAATTDFSKGAGRRLLDVYEQHLEVPSPELFQLARLWIRQHRSDAEC